MSVKNHLVSRDRIQIGVMLAPAVLIVLLLFGGGLVLALAASGGPSSYRRLATDREFLASSIFTLWVASASTAISALLGLLLALGLREAARRSALFHALLQVPVATPHLVMAVAVINIIAPSGLLARCLHAAGVIGSPADFPAWVGDPSGFGIILVYVLKEAPFIALMCVAMLARTGIEHEMVASTLGAGAWQRLRYVTLPLVAPAWISASLVVFAFVFSAFEVPFLLGRTYPSTLGVVAQRRFMSLEIADRPEAMAIAVTISFLTVLVVWFYLRLSKVIMATEEPALF